MKLIRITYKLFIIFLVLFSSSCQDLTELNENPNGVEPSTVNPNLLLPTVMTFIGTNNTILGYNGDGIAGVMQQLQKDSWASEFNNYDWDEKDWDDYYSALSTNDLAYDRAVELGYEFHQGVALVLKSYIFGRITDLWGDAPYTNALNADDNVIFPEFDSQETIYKGIINDLAEASELLSKDASEYDNINDGTDLFFDGDPAMWQKFANSLALRYYMRLSVKLPDYAEEGVKKILNEPLFSSIDEECSLAFVGSGNEDSWPTNTVYDASASSFKRVKPCATLTDKLKSLTDPRINVWFNPVEVPIVISDKYDSDDTVVDKVRYIRGEYLETKNIKIYNSETFKEYREDGYTLVDTSSIYVGLPPSVASYDPFDYNLNPNPTLGGGNEHVSYMSDLFKEAEDGGELLKSRILSYAEVCFLKAEAALNGWGGNAEECYNAGIKASLEDWGIGDEYDSYIDNDGVVYEGTLEQIMEQKWIASFTVATEAWMDWRRTGYPNLQTGSSPLRDRIPLRYYYGNDEKNINASNYQDALSGLETTNYSLTDGEDSAWSKMWLIQDTDKPW